MPDQSPLPPHAFYPPHGPAAEALARRVAQGLPPSLVALWIARGRGVLVVEPDATPRWEPGPLLWRDVQAWGALRLPPACPSQALWGVVGAWLDHFAGSLGGPARLSAGHGATAALQETATRFARVVALGYAADALGTDEPGELLARAVAAYRCDRQTLSAADPLLARWLSGTLFDEGLWRRVRAEQTVL